MVNAIDLSNHLPALDPVSLQALTPCFSTYLTFLRGMICKGIFITLMVWLNTRAKHVISTQ